jgi:type I restriction enzyme M protein
MLDQETKNKISKLRDILVGKVPDPKGQIEQIVIGLIYKFMNDMDEESISLGGEASFFIGELEKYSWNNLLGSKVTGTQLVDLYSTAVESMEENPNLPPLFRDIFKNAFIPYKDPQTLRLFLGLINEFDYRKDSEQLGDAFEHLLDSLSSQGDAGQFRTPRHIIDFIVQITDPKKDDTILDPASGTSGFIISAFKHILNSNTNQNIGDELTSSERKKVMRNIKGYDISPDMVRIGLANMYLHGFPDPSVEEYDTLSSDERWNEYYNIFLANPPFMTPTGGINPHNKFKNSSNRAEVLFLDYMLLHLKPKGKIGVVVPEGIIFQDNSSYREIRQDLIKNGLFCVVSLPQGVFKPYSDVKTSILFLDKTFDGEAILFSKVDNDGYTLTDRRSKIEMNDLPLVAKDIDNFKNENYDFSNSFVVDKEEVLNNSALSFNFKSYQVIDIDSDFETVPLGELLEECKERNKELKYEVSSVTNDKGLVNPESKFNNQVASKDTSNYKLVKENNFVYNPSRINVGSITVNKKEKTVCVSPMYVVFRVVDKNRLDENFLFDYLTSKLFIDSLPNYTSGSVRQTLKYKDLANINIPLPPLEKQQKIVDEIEQYQKVIDGAMQVVENYKPTLEIDPSWEMVELGELISFSQLGLVKSTKEQSDVQDSSHKFSYFKMNNITYAGDVIYDKSVYVDASEEEVSKYSLVEGDFLFNTRNTPELVGKCCVMEEPKTSMLFNNNILRLRFTDNVRSEFVALILNTQFFKKELMRMANATTGVAAIYKKNLLSIKIPLPSLELQNSLVDPVLLEKNFLRGNQELIQLSTRKIQNIVQKLYKK